MNDKIQATAADRQLTQQELESVSGGTSIVSEVVGAIKEIAKNVVKILDTGTIGNSGDINQGVNAGARM